MLSDASLPAACRAFRAAFPAASGGGHRQVCPACAAWALHRQAVASARSARRRLPGALADRLRAIPLTVRDCPAGDDLVRWTRAAARGTDALPAVAAHVAGCDRCRALADVLASAFAAPRRVLPRALESRLRSVAKRVGSRSLVWAFDLRAASVAALLFGFLLIPVAGPTAAWARQAGSAVTEPITQWRVPRPRSDAAEEILAAALETAQDSAARILEGGRRKLAAYAASWDALVARSRSIYERVLDLRVPDRPTNDPGPSDARSGDDEP